MSKRIRVQYDEGSDEEKEVLRKLKKKKKLEEKYRKEPVTLIRKVDSSAIDKQILDSIYGTEYHEIHSIPRHYIGVVSYEDREEICVYDDLNGGIQIHTTDEVLRTGKIRLMDSDYRLIHLLIWTYRCNGKEIPLYVRFRNGNKSDLSTSNIHFSVCKRRPAGQDYKNFTVWNKITGESFNAESINEIGDYLGINHLSVMKRLSHGRHYLGWQIRGHDHVFCVEMANGEKTVVHSVRQLSK